MENSELVGEFRFRRRGSGVISDFDLFVLFFVWSYSWEGWKGVFCKDGVWFGFYRSCGRK